MTFSRFAPLVLCAGAMLAACSSGSDATPPPANGSGPPLQAFHAVPDLGAITFVDEQDGQVVVWANMEFGRSTGAAPLPQEVFSLHFDTLLPGQGDAQCTHRDDDEDPCTRLASAEVDVTEGREYTAVVVGSYGDLEVVLYDRPRHEFATDEANAQVHVLHLSQTLGEFDVYLEAPDAALSPVDARATLSPAEDFHGLVPSGEYQITLTAVGDPQAVLFSSNPVEIDARTRLSVAILDGADSSTSDIQARLFGSLVGTLLNRDAAPALRVVHAARNGGNVDVYTGGDLTSPIVTDLGFGEVSPPSDMPTGEVFLNMTPAGSTGTFLLQREITLAQAEPGTFFLTGADTGSLGGVRVADDFRRLATHARIRVTHAASSRSSLRFYVVPPGSDIEELSPSSTLGFPASSNFLRLAPGSYEILLANADDEVLAGPFAVELNAFGVYGVAAVDGEDPAVPELLLLEDLAAGDD